MADGLGGHEFGALAAQTAINAVKRSLAKSRSHSVEVAAKTAVEAASVAVTNGRALTASEMASTLSVLVADSDQAGWAYVGDTRIYRIVQGKSPVRLSVDQSMAMALASADDRAVIDLRGDPERNHLLSVLGQVDLTIATGAEAIQEAAAYALCSDGYWESAIDADLFPRVPDDSEIDGWTREAVLRQVGKADNTTLVVLYTSDQVRS